MSIQESIRIVPQGDVAVVEFDLVGEKVNETDSLLGWFSPTYLTRLPALSFWIETEAGLPFELRTEFQIYSK